VLNYKAEMHERIASFKAELAENTRKRNPFIAKVNERSLAQARTFKQKKETEEMGFDLMDDQGMDDIEAKLEMEV
jgi:hypothetical protein